MAQSRQTELRQNILLAGGGMSILIVVVVFTLATTTAERLLRRQADNRLAELANQSAALVDQFVLERRRELQMLGAMPAVVAAARDATTLAEAASLPALSVPELEARYRDTRALGGADELREFLEAYVANSFFAEVFLTNRFGHVVVGSGLTSDFVQSDEAWWRRAFADGAYEGSAEFDESAGVVAVEYDLAIRPPGAEEPVGVIKAVFDLTFLGQGLGSELLRAGTTREIVDSSYRLLLATNAADLLQPVADSAGIPLGAVEGFATVGGSGGSARVVSAPANAGKWWVVLRQPEGEYRALIGSARLMIGAGSVVLLVAVLVLLFFTAVWLNRRVIEPIKEAGAVASQIAGGDLSTSLGTEHVRRETTEEVRQLMAAVDGMVGALRTLVGAIYTAADEAAAMAAEISASTQEMSASTEQMAATTQELSRRASAQAALVRAAADDAVKILHIATDLSQGADEAAGRNATLAETAQKHHDRLHESTTVLKQFAEEVAQGAEEADRLAEASTEVQQFVTQAKAIANQTSMLALNAAIEAARAGPEGRGFAVVADEVRKLASQASAAASQTAEIVRGVLARVHQARERLSRLSERSEAIREVAETTADGLRTVASEAAANRVWTDEISKASSEVRALIDEIANRLKSIAEGTEGFASSAQEIAASSQQQSASTQEIASSSSRLAEAADRLTHAVSTFRLEKATPDEEPVSHSRRGNPPRRLSRRGWPGTR